MARLRFEQTRVIQINPPMVDFIINQSQMVPDRKKMKRNVILQPEETKHALILSNVYTLNDHEDIKQLQVGAVLSIIDNQMYNHFKVKAKIEHMGLPSHKWIDLMDEDDTQIYPHFQGAVEWIDNERKKHAVLVHCQGGISRSSSLVIAYLIREKGMDFQEARDYVKARRKHIEPNESFTKDLLKWSEEHRKK